MARLLGALRNTLKIFDNISQSEIVFYYRQPTTSERHGFQNMAVQRQRNKVSTHIAEARLAYGLKILVGFRDGDLVRLEDGKEFPMASDEGSDNYYPNWKKEVEKHAGDLAMLLGAHVFETPAEIQGDDAEIEGESQATLPQ